MGNKETLIFKRQKYYKHFLIKCKKKKPLEITNKNKKQTKSEKPSLLEIFKPLLNKSWVEGKVYPEITDF